jgi:hypothetical protein
MLMRKKEIKVALFPERQREAETAPLPSPAAQLGRIVSLSDDGQVAVELPDAAGPVPARLAIAASHEAIRNAIETRQPAVLVFENGERRRPIVVGLIAAATPPVIVEHTPAPATVVEADVDGKRVRVTAQEEIVLQCGSASVTLRRNGRVVIRGTYVETHSQGTNRIKGGQVQIN